MNETVVGQTLLDRYHLIRLIGSGGMADVFEAIDQHYHCTVAIKTLHLGLANHSELGEQLNQRFEQEAQISRLLGNHPNIIRVLDYGKQRDQPFLVMEYLGEPPLLGSNLNDWLAHTGPMQPEWVIRLARQMCSGLHYAHTFRRRLDTYTIKGVIHRDLKPGNIFILQDPLLGPEEALVKILDFGVVKVMSDIALTLGTKRMGGFIGSLPYASPEQLQGKRLDPRSDVYALGVVLYEMLTGQLPYRAPYDHLESWLKVHEQPATPIQSLNVQHSISYPLASTVMACLERDPNQRPESMQALSQALAACFPTQGLQMKTTLQSQIPSLKTPTDTDALASEIPISLKPSQSPATTPLKPRSYFRKPWLIPAGLLGSAAAALLLLWLTQSVSDQHASPSVDIAAQLATSTFRFFCGQRQINNQLIPATIVERQPDQQFVIVIEWDPSSANFGEDWPAQRRCEEVSQRFQTLYDQDRLRLITIDQAAWISEQAIYVVCSQPTYGPDVRCQQEDLLLTVGVQTDPNELLRRLFETRFSLDQMGTPPPEAEDVVDPAQLPIFFFSGSRIFYNILADLAQSDPGATMRNMQEDLSP